MISIDTAAHKERNHVFRIPSFAFVESDIASGTMIELDIIGVPRTNGSIADVLESIPRYCDIRTIKTIDAPRVIREIIGSYGDV